MQIEALKGSTGAKGKCMAENIISAIHVDGIAPHLHCDFVPLTKRESIGERRDGRQKKMRRTQEEFLEAMQEGVPRAKFTFGWRKPNLTADQTLRKMTASIKT